MGEDIKRRSDDGQPTDVTSDGADTTAVSGFPSSGSPLIDAAVADLMAQPKATMCWKCSGALEPGKDGGLCLNCQDQALLEIATLLGVNEIASNAVNPDSLPAAEHPIWGILHRRLEKKQAGESVADVYPVLEELRLLRDPDTVNTDEGDVTLKLADGIEDQCYLLEYRHENQETTLVASIGREKQAAELPQLVEEFKAQRIPEQLAREKSPAVIARFEEAFLEDADQQKLSGGRIFVPKSPIRLEDVLYNNLGDELWDALHWDWGFRQILAWVFQCEPSCVIHYWVYHILGWDWYLMKFRLGDRGYFFMENDPAADSGQPVVGAWEPYDSPEAFRACIIAAYQHHFDSIGPSQHALLLGVTDDEFCEALWEGLERNPWGWETIADYAYDPDGRGMAGEGDGALPKGWDPQAGSLASVEERRRILERYCRVIL